MQIIPTATDATLIQFTPGTNDEVFCTSLDKENKSVVSAA
jgi:hypothetical protein